MSGDPVKPVRARLRVLRGSTFSIPAGGLVISADGDMELRKVLLSTATWLEWLHIVFERIEAPRQLLVAVADSDEESEALNQEVRARS
jgi:hypothetical protein